MIHKVKGYHDGQECYVISTHQVGVEGNYATKQAARWAFQFNCDELSELQERVNRKEQRPITTDDLREVYKNRKLKKYVKNSLQKMGS